MNNDLPMLALGVSAILFCLGVIGLLARRNLLLILVSIEVMLNAAGFAFVAGGAAWDQADGQVMFLFILAVAASEVAVGLALTLQLHRQNHSLDTNRLNRLRD